MLICEEYLTPGSLDEAFAAMQRHHGRHRIVAGCTDILPWARAGRAGDAGNHATSRHVGGTSDAARRREPDVSKSRLAATYRAGQQTDSGPAHLPGPRLSKPIGASCLL